MLEVLFWLALGIVAYVYAGYPLVLWIASRFVSREPMRKFESWPSVTLVISAYNEEKAIREKIANTFAIDYPNESLEILVVSDASSDRTEAIVGEYAARGIQLLRMSKRGGKTVGLNKAVSVACGEVIVFSDANAMYRTDAVKALLGGFCDPKVGAVIGESTYVAGETDSERAEGLYWRYETSLKAMESAIGSVVGGDGAIYAVRKSLYSPMMADALSDFVNPLQVVRQGYRCVYERAAQSVEKAGENFGVEFRRKVRIVNRAWRATMSFWDMMNPVKYGWFAIALISHKLLRWLVPAFLVIILVCNLALLKISIAYWATLLCQLVFYSVAGLASRMRRRGSLPAVFYVPYYFCLVNIASVWGIVEAFRGKKYTAWSTARAD